MVTHKDINDFCDSDSEAGTTSSYASNSSLNEDQSTILSKLKDVFGLKMNVQAEPKLAGFIKILLKEIKRFNDNAEKAVEVTSEFKEYIGRFTSKDSSFLQDLADEMGLPIDRLASLLTSLGPENMTRDGLKDILSDLLSEIMLESSTKYAFKAKQSFKDTIRELIDKFGGPVLLLVMAATAALYSYWSRTKGTLLISAACAACYYVVYPDHVTDVASYLSDVMNFKVPSEEEVVMAEPEFGMCDIEPAVGALLTALFMLFAPKDVDNFMNLEFMVKIMKRATDIAKAAPSLSKIFEYIMWAIQEIYNGIAVKFFNADPITLRPSGFPMFDVYFKKFQALEAKYDAKNFELTQDNYNALMDLYNDGLELSRILPSDNAHRTLHSRLSEMLKFLRQVKEVFNASNFSDEGLRQEAVGVLFMGGPGTGKSISMEYLYNAVLAAVFSHENDTRRLELLSKDPSMFLFNRQAETAYWEGYTRDKMVTFFDDLGQMKDVAGNPDGEWMNIIRAINSFQYNLHMASLNSKSNTYFRSQFVFASTNLTEFRPQSIISAEAFTRRFCLAFMVKPKEQYLDPSTVGCTPYNQRYDFSRLPSYVDEYGVKRTKFNPDVQDFLLYDLKTGRLTGHVYTFDQVVELVFKAYCERKSWIKETKNDLRETQRKYIGKYRKPDAPVFQAWFPDDYQVSKSDGFTYVFKTTPNLSLLYSVPERYVKMARSYCNDDPVKALILYLFIAQMANQYHVEGTPKFSHCASLSQYFRSFCQRNNGKDFFQILNADWKLPAEVYEKIQVIGEPFTEPFFLEEEAFKYLALLPDECKPFPILNNDVTYANIFNVPPYFDITVWNTFKGYWKDVIRLTKSVYTKEYWKNEHGYWSHSFTEKFMTFHGHFAAVVVAIPMIQIVLYGLQTLVNTISPPKETISQSFTGWDRQNRLKKVMQQRPRGVSAPVAQPQMDSGLDPNGEALIKPVFEKNCYRVTTQAKDGSTAQMGYIIFVKGRKALMPYHFIEQFLEIEQKGFGDNVIDFSSYEPIYNCDKNRFSFTVTQLIEGIFDWDHQYPSFELGILNFPSSVRFHADITRKFLPLSSLNSNMRYHLRFDYFDRKSGAARASFCQGASFQKSFKMAAMQGMVTIINCVIDYPMPTDSGDCGTLVSIVDKTKGQSRILGFHIAGTVSLCMGHGQFLPRELIEEVVEGRMTWYDNYVSPGDRPSSPLAVPQGAVQTKVETDPRFRLIDSDPSPKYTPYNVSKIIASPLYGKVSTVLEKPALLRPKKIEGVYIDPELKALNKYCVNHDFPVNRDLVDQAVGDYFDFMESASYFTVDRRVFTFEEAVAGLENDPDFGSIDRSTSSGYPYNTVPELKNGKKGFFGSEGPFDFDNQHAVSLKHDVMADIFDLQRGIRVPEIFCDSLKDETRPIEKVNQASTRLFSAGNIKLLIKSRMYFGAFQLWYVKNRVRNGGTLGLNPYSDEWGEMANMLHTFSDEPFIGAGDYSAFDASEVPAIHWRICDAINAWYNDEHSLVRRTLFFELAQSRHYFKGSIYEWSSSLPSGHPLTSLINCIYNQVAFRMCWISLLDSIPVAMRPERDEFHNHVVLFVHGDDNLFAVSDWAAQFFTMDFIQSAMAENLGLQYTDETKGDTIKGWRSITDVEFLKRSFRYDDKLQRWVAPWRLTALLECLNWTRKGDQALQIVFDKVQLALKELSLHEKEVFDYWHALISRMYYLKLGRHSPPSLPVGYRRCQSMVLDQPFFLY